MKRIGIIDIGSNSVRLVLFRIYRNGSFKIIDELKESVRLAEGMNKDNKIQEDKIISAIEIIKTFKILSEAVEVDSITAVATEAVRKAHNQKEFIERISEETGINIRVLTGYEEAYYDYLGVINSMDINDALLIDIGGSSTELVWVKDRKAKECVSLPIGAINLTQKFNIHDKVSKDNENEIIKFVNKYYSTVPWLSQVGNIPLIGIGGTIRNIGKIHRKINRYPLEISHNYFLKATDVKQIYDLVKNKSYAQRRKMSGLSKERADIFPAAVLSVQTLINNCKIDNIRISGNGLREGVIYDIIIKEFGEINDVLDFSIQNILVDSKLNKIHAENVFNIVTKLYDGLIGEFESDYNINKIIKTASLLHDSGYNVSYYGHHKHSFYIILNSRINGLTHKELLMSAYIASFHRKDKFKIETYKYSQILSKKDIEFMQKLGVILKIAESLDRSRAGLVKDINVFNNKEETILELYAEDNIDLEVNDAEKAVTAFKRVFKKKLKLKTVG